MKNFLQVLKSFKMSIFLEATIILLIVSFITLLTPLIFEDTNDYDFLQNDINLSETEDTIEPSCEDCDLDSVEYRINYDYRISTLLED